MLSDGDARDGVPSAGTLRIRASFTDGIVNILLDECVPWPLAKYLLGHACSSVQRCGWGGIKNGELLRLAEAQFDLFITSDQSLVYQQNLAGRRIAILLLSTNKLRRVVVSATLIQSEIMSLQTGEYRHLQIP
jgi:hypothetical protein